MKQYDSGDLHGACEVCQGMNPDCLWCKGTGVQTEDSE